MEEKTSPVRTGIRRLLSEVLSGMSDSVGPGESEALGRPDLLGTPRHDLELLLRQPEFQARAEELKATAKQRLQIPGKDTEDFKIFQQAARNVFSNPLVRFGVTGPLERNQLINEEFEILRASRKGKVAPSLIGQPGVPPKKTNPITQGKIRVRVKTTGQTGTIDEKDFKAGLFERL